MKYRISFLLLALFNLSLIAQEAQAPQSEPKVDKAQVFKSVQALSIGNTKLNFDTEAGTHLLRDEKDEPIALFGYTYYELKNEKADKPRPIVFAFNGGPLSASFWLHMGVLGPKRIVIKDTDYTPGAPYKVVNNEYSILEEADLVMIDPVGVGLSKPTGKAQKTDFWGVEEDIRSIGLFIEQFLIKKGRLNDPKFLLGESYGTFRNAGLMLSLQNKGINMNGVIMVSAVFDLVPLIMHPENDLAYLIHFPTYAATAWYHQKADRGDTTLEDFLAEVRKFTEEVYAPALFLGDKLNEQKRNELLEQLVHFTGIDKKVWENANLRLHVSEFFQELERDQGLTIGRFDTRFTGINQDPMSQVATIDPGANAISPPFITAFKNYLYNDLNVSTDLTYTPASYVDPEFTWNMERKSNMLEGAQVAISTANDMATAMSQNPNLKVLILNGLLDLATPFYGVEYTVDHLGLTPDIKKNIQMEYYEAGHMMYIHPPSLKKFKEDVGGFIRSAY